MNEQVNTTENDVIKNYVHQKTLQKKREWNARNKEKVAEYRKKAIVNAYVKLISEYPQYAIGGVAR